MKTTAEEILKKIFDSGSSQDDLRLAIVLNPSLEKIILAMQSYASLKEDKWISVGERLPETNSQHSEDFISDEVVVYSEDGISTDRYRRSYDLKVGTGKKISEDWLNFENVTHWQPLPSPPKAEK